MRRAIKVYFNVGMSYSRLMREVAVDTLVSFWRAAGGNRRAMHKMA